MKVETGRHHGYETIAFPDNPRRGDREVCLFNTIEEVGFYRNNEGPVFTIDELRELLPYLQRAVENNSFEPQPKYELVELGRDTFAIRKTGTDRFYSEIPLEGWRRTIAFLFTKKEAKIMLAQLEEGKE